MEIPEVGWGSKVKVPSVAGGGGGGGEEGAAGGGGGGGGGGGRRRIFSEVHIWKLWFFRREENRRTRRETSRSKGENQ